MQHETGRTRWNSYYADNVVQLFNNGAAASVRLGLPVDFWNGLRNYGLFVNDSYRRDKLTVNLGLRYDRYRVFLPEQERPASRFSVEARSFGGGRRQDLQPPGAAHRAPSSTSRATGAPC